VVTWACALTTVPWFLAWSEATAACAVVSAFCAVGDTGLALASVELFWDLGQVLLRLAGADAGAGRLRVSLRGTDLLGSDVVARRDDVLGVARRRLRGGQVALGVLDRDPGQPRRRRRSAAASRQARLCVRQRLLGILHCDHIGLAAGIRAACVAARLARVVVEAL